MKKFLIAILGITSINLAVAAENLASCRITGVQESSISVERWDGPKGVGTHFSPLVRVGNLHYQFGQSLDGKSDVVSLSRGRDQSGGVAYDFHVSGTLPLTLTDVQNNVSINCQPN